MERKETDGVKEEGFRKNIWTKKNFKKQVHM